MLIWSLAVLNQDLVNFSGLCRSAVTQKTCLLLHLR